MTNDKPRPSDPPMELNDETVSDLDAIDDPQGGLRATGYTVGVTCETPGCPGYTSGPNCYSERNC